MRASKCLEIDKKRKRRRGRVKMEVNQETNQEIKEEEGKTKTQMDGDGLMS